MEDIKIKICSKCGIEKNINLFFKDLSHKDGLTSNCKDCYKLYKNQPHIKEKNKEWSKIDYKKNKEKHLEYNKQKYILNKNEHSLRMSIWRNNNKEKIKEYHQLLEVKERKNFNHKKLLKNNPNIKLKSLLRSRLWELLKKNKTNKSKSALTLLGCSIKECKSYLENLFLPEFTWENHGIIWEIDHIIPCSKFDLTILEEQQNCFHYTNLKPIFKTTEIAIQHGYLDQIGNRNKNSKII